MPRVIEIAWIVCMPELSKKYKFAALLNCTSKLNGTKVNNVYLVVLILLSRNLTLSLGGFCPK